MLFHVSIDSFSPFPFPPWHVVVLSKDKTNLKVGCLYRQHRFVAGVDFEDWKDTSGRNVKIFTGNMPQHVTSCAAARDLLLPIFLNAVVSGKNSHRIKFELCVLCEFNSIEDNSIISFPRRFMLQTLRKHICST